MKMSKHTAVVAAVLTMFSAGAAMAQIQGVITTPEGRKIEGTIKWKAREKTYAVTAKGGNVELEMAPANISDLQIPKPKELDAAIASVQQGSAAAAVPVLEKLAGEYLMLQWDTVATRLLAEAHVKAGEPEKAIRVCEKVIASNPNAAFLGEMAPAYWQALIKADRVSKVEDLLAKAIKSGDRSSSAFALIVRGDVILVAGDTNENAKKALRDGYLRVVRFTKPKKPRSRRRFTKRLNASKRSGRRRVLIRCGRR